MAENTHDIIIAGGGATGCLIAGRLAAADPNLKILARPLHERGDRVIGIECIRDTILNPDADQTVRVAEASKLVVISAGAFGSPTILERSAIGRADVLKNVGVDVKVDLAGVGENYQDHSTLRTSYLASDETESLDALMHCDPVAEAEHLELYSQGKGLIAANGLDAGIKLRLSTFDFILIGFFSICSYFGKPGIASPNRKYFNFCMYTQYPISLGRVHTTDPVNPNKPTEFDTPPTSSPFSGDIKRPGSLLGEWTFIAESSSLSTPLSQKAAQLSPTLNERDLFPLMLPQLINTEEDDKALENFVRNHAQTMWHSMGTCAMKPRKEGGVVDSKLNIYGIKGLNVADLSIAPQNVSANTYSTALVIGEKAVTIIAAELGINYF